jgi:hypothetical protein
VRKKRRHAAARRLTRLSWTLQGRGNPLRRPVDRREGRTIAGLLTMFLVAGPLAGVISGQLAYRAEVRQMQAEQSWRKVTATLLQNASDATGVGSNWDPSVMARWRAPDGQQKTGVLPVDSSATAGQHVTIWVDGQGTLTASQMRMFNVVANAVAIGIGSPFALAVILLLAGCTMRLVLNRRRLAGWEYEWRMIEPRWRTPH